MHGTVATFQQPYLEAMKRLLGVVGVLAFVLLGPQVVRVQTGGQDGSIGLEGLVREGSTVRVSEHVYVIPDRNAPLVPNIGIVVGSRATLVVDTGLGPINAQTVLREVEKLARGTELYVVSTHYHPEHAAGEMSFPETARVVRARAQQQDIDERGADSLLRFRGFSPLVEELLAGVRYRAADTIFDREHEIDLGELRVRLMAWGPTHTRGDTMVFVPEDHVLIAGDVVMKDRFLVFVSPESSLDTWITVLQDLEPLQPRHIVPSHGALGDGSLLATQRTYLERVQARVRELRAAGVTVEDAAATLTEELRAVYPDWVGDRWIDGAARSAYREAP